MRDRNDRKHLDAVGDNFRVDGEPALVEPIDDDSDRNEQLPWLQRNPTFQAWRLAAAARTGGWIAKLPCWR